MASNDPVWMPQALKIGILIQLLGWVIPHTPLLALWGNKNWPPTMKVENVEIVWKKMGLNGCK